MSELRSLWDRACRWVVHNRRDILSASGEQARHMSILK